MSERMEREEILRRFEQMLDSALADEQPPSGVDAEILAAVSEDGAEETAEAVRRCDEYELWAAVIALTQEVKLQGRAFKELNDTLGAQPDRIAEEIREACREREREQARETERRCRREALNILIDVRDRMARGLDSVREGAAEIERSGRADWLPRLFSRRTSERAAETLAALRKGYELAMERVDQALDEYNAREIRCAGEMFDPRRMNAIDREESGAVPAGTVLEVYRTGYEWNGEVFRPAQVKVSCEPEESNGRTDRRN